MKSLRYIWPIIISASILTLVLFFQYNSIKHYMYWDAELIGGLLFVPISIFCNYVATKNIYYSSFTLFFFLIIWQLSDLIIHKLYFTNVASYDQIAIGIQLILQILFVMYSITLVLILYFWKIHKAQSPELHHKGFIFIISLLISLGFIVVVTNKILIDKIILNK